MTTSDFQLTLLIIYFDRLSTDDGDDTQRRSTITNAEMGMPCCEQTTVCTRPTMTIHQHSNRDRGRQLTNRIGLNDFVGRRSLVSKPKSFIFISIFVLSTLTDDEHHHNLWDGGCHKISSNKAFSFFPFPFSFSVFFYVLATTIFSTTSTTTTTTTKTTHQHHQHFNQHPKPLNASKRRWQQQQ